MLDSDHSLRSLCDVCTRIFAALQPGGALIFDVAEPGRCRRLQQAFREGEDWTCLVEYQHDESKQMLTRRIVTFRKIGDIYRRHEETHRQQLFEERCLLQMLRESGFQVRSVRSYGEYRLSDGVVGFVAEKPGVD